MATEMSSPGPQRQRSLKDRIRDGITFTWQGKSRSVDHVIGGDIEGFGRRRVNMTSSGSASASPVPYLADESLPREPMSPKTPVKVAPPENVVPYMVQGSDTLTSIAARYDITPTELAKLNRLTTRLVFPSQVLHVPDKVKVEQLADTSIDEKDEDLLSNIRPPAGVRPGHIERIASGSGGPDSPSIPVDEDLDKDCLEKFLKINVRHITDGQGVVAGVLLVTPNALMFDPNVSDPLVIEHGPEAYGVIAPMEYVVSGALYTDIAHMKVRDRGNIPLPNIPKPEVYHPKKGSSFSVIPTVEEETATPPSTPKSQEPTTTVDAGMTSSLMGIQEVEATVPPLDSTLSKDLTFPELALKSSVEEETGSDCSCGPRDDSSAFPKAFERDFVTPEPEDKTRRSRDEEVNSEERRTTTDEAGVREEEKRQTVWFDLPEKKEEPANPETRKQKVLKRLSYPLSWMESFSGDRDSRDDSSGSGSAPSSADFSTQSKSVFSNVMSNVSSMSNVIARRTSLDFAKKTTPTRQIPIGSTTKMGYKSMVSVDDMPELFAAFDKLIPKPARSCDDPPLYLCLKMGKKINQKIPKTASIMSYGRKMMRAEYWFSIPRDRCDELYNFFQHWAADTYGDLETTNPEARGYELVDSDTELFDGESNEGGEGAADVEGEEGERRGIGELTNQSWEMVSMSEELRHALYSTSMTSMDFDYLPELKGKSEILTEDHRKKLCKKLLARAEGYPWTLVFSTSQHGFSLKSMYRKLQELECPLLMVVEDTYHNIFGVVSSCSFYVSEHFYGTGESFLFSFYPEFRTFGWTGDNLYFVKGNMESISFGAGDGEFGLWLDGDLYQGRTRPCKTYGNDPLTSNEDFVVKTMECWGFI